MAFSAIGVLAVGVLPSWVVEAAQNSFGNFFG
jgi:hypothetical protein